MKRNSGAAEPTTLTRMFGVGCFDFRLIKPVPYSLTDKEYADSVIAALKKLSSSNEIAVEYETSMGGTIEIDEEIPSLENGGCFPALPFCRIGFSLFIPHRIQEELAYGGLVVTETENFRVTVRHLFYGPVAYVECVKAGYECDPSQAVEVVRKYLEREFKKIDGVAFESLGPSPFHMDFFVREGLNVDGVEAAVTPRKGYDRMDIEVDWSLEPADALDKVFYELGTELDDFYHLERQRLTQMNAWNSLEEEWDTLRTLVSDRMPFYNFRRKFQIHRKARDLVTEAFTFAANHSISKQDATETVNDTYGKGLKTYLKDCVEAQKLSAFPDYPTQAIVEWAKHVHDSSFKLAELAIVFFSALLGGVIGAILTAILTAKSPATQENPSQVAAPVSTSRP